MQIAFRAIDDIKPYEKNPRVNDAAVDSVARSLKEFGFRQPIVVDEHGVIVVGHTRWKAAQKLGLAKVPVHVAKDLTREQIKAYRIADNKVTVTVRLFLGKEERQPIRCLRRQGRAGCVGGENRCGRRRGSETTAGGEAGLRRS